jgi:hypothetical protein
VVDAVLRLGEIAVTVRGEIDKRLGAVLKHVQEQQTIQALERS